jgi:NADH dehydrogenase FAD-containing subunit
VVKVNFLEGKALAGDIESRCVLAEDGFDAHVDELEFDQLVLALGSTLHYFGTPGVKENALMMRSCKDTVTLHKRLIAAPGGRQRFGYEFKRRMECTSM